MKTKVMEGLVTSETVSQNTISGKMEGFSKDSRVPEIAKSSSGYLVKIQNMMMMIKEVIMKKKLKLSKQVKI